MVKGKSVLGLRPSTVCLMSSRSAGETEERGNNIKQERLKEREREREREREK